MQMKNKINCLSLAICVLGMCVICSAQTPVFPLKKSSNSRYLVDQNNTPFPIMGRTAWFVISLSVDDYKTFIDNTVSHGYNSIEMHVINHDPNANHPPFNGNGDLPFLKRLDGSNWDGTLVYTDTTAQAPDMTTPNEPYWQYVDSFLSYCESKGVQVFFFPAYTGYPGSDQGWMPELVANGVKRSQAYGNWIANRYKNQKNIVWMLLGDMGKFTTAEKEAEGALIAGLKSVPGQLSTEYSAETGPGQSSADNPDFGDQMTLNGAYTWTIKDMSVPKLGRIAYSHDPVMPAYLLEEPYDEEGPDGSNYNPSATQPVRRFQWWGWLTTIGGYISGNGYIWRFNQGWKKHMDTKNTYDMERLNKFIRSITWWKLVPSGLDGMKTLITAGGSTTSDSNYVAAAATREGTLLVAYVPPSHKGSITVDMTAMAGITKARWFDPTSGAFTNISGSPFAHKGTRQFTPPGKNHVGQNDWVLLLEAKESIGKKSSAMQMPISGPLKASKNPNYFQDTNGKTLILCGSHSWNTLQDWGSNGSIQKLDFDAFVRFLNKHNHNFTLIWSTELPKFHGFPTTDTSPPDITVTPFPWLRTGPGVATDGGLKFDLTKFNQEYFDRLRGRVQALGNAGIYAGVYVFSGEWLLRFRSATDGYPFSGNNNVNGVDDGYKGGSVESAVAATTMNTTNAITEFQDTYVKKLINTLNDLPNVLWIVSQEASENSTWWNDHLISFVRAYEKGMPYQHPIGLGGLDNSLTDRDIYNNDADWVAPWGRISPSRSCGTGKPACKVNINDSDHSYWEIWKDTPQKNRNYVWQNFANGNQVAFMDPYVVSYTRQGRNMVDAPINGIGHAPDARWDNFRDNLGYILKYSQKMNLTKILPQQVLSSTGYCIAQTPATGAEYLVYASNGGPFTVDLSAMSNKRKLAVEWFNPSTGTTMSQSPIAAGSSSQSFSPPFEGDAVLYLVDTTGHK
jgi:hypothetical protein